MLILGITGNIGSGKSTVSQLLAAQGAAISHSDDLAKNLLESDGELLDQLSDRFGADILNDQGVLQKSILAERAFVNSEQQTYLNHLIHPRVRTATLQRIAAARRQQAWLFVIDAPLLFEAGVDTICDTVLVVAADEHLRRTRIYQRSNISQIDFEHRDALQLPIDEKIRRADHVIHNNGNLSDLKLAVERLVQTLKASAARADQ